MNVPDRLRVITFSRPPGLIAAFARGHFADEGLTVERARATSSTAQIRGLLSGASDLAHTAADNVMAFVDAERADLCVVLVADLGLDHVLVARPEVGRVADLRDRSVAVDAPTSGYALVLYRMLEREGVPRGTYEVRAVGGTAERLAALRSGDVAAALVGGSGQHEAIAAGLRVIARAAAYAPGHPGTSVAARRSWAAAHRDLVVRYCRALLAGWRWVGEPRHREQATALLAAELGLGAEAAARLYEDEVRGRERLAPSVREMEAALTRTATLRREMTGRAAPVDVRAYFDPSYALAAGAPSEATAP